MHPSAGRKPQQGQEHIPAWCPAWTPWRLCPALGLLIHEEIYPRLLGQEHDQQNGALEADGAGQAQAGAGVLLQGSLAGTHLVIFS